MATVEVVAERFSLDQPAVQASLDDASERGWVQFRAGRLTGWTLTTTGRDEGERLLSEELRQTQARPTIEAAYELFVGLNGELLSICTDWQAVVVDGVEVVNDHTDAVRDAAVLERLELLHVQILPVTRLLADALERFGGYGSRLSAAHERIIGGETEWLTRPTIDSYHTVWFELHEDLLATLGRRRSEERHGPAGGPH
ncbi:hypothetical protein BH10ACT3_BH10ACT3_03630 [soil metagenome]